MEDRYTPTPGPFGLRLCRAAGLVALGAAIHVLLPQGRSAPVPLTSPLKVARVDAQEPRPALLVEQTMVFAPVVGDLGDPLGLRPPATRPVGTSGRVTLLATASPQPGTAAEPDPVTALSLNTPQPFDLDPDRLPVLSLQRSGLREAEGTGTEPAEMADPVARTARMASALIGTPPPPVVADSRPALIAAVPALAEPPAAAEPIEPLNASMRAAAVNAVSDEALVRRLLDEYAGAFERLDVSATKAVWPSVNGKALERAYGQLASQRLNLQACGITISGSTANARCQGSATYQPRIGNRPVVASREWTFALSKQDASWRIDALR